MTSHRIHGCSALTALLLVFPIAAFAQGSDQQREACTPDAFRLCSAYMPDADRVTGCLRASGARLSPACYEVFFPSQNARGPQQPGGPRRRSNNPPPAPVQDDDD